MGCTFCATGTMGLEGDLTAGEIVEQLVHANRVTPIRNVVFMVRRGQAGGHGGPSWRINACPRRRPPADRCKCSIARAPGSRATHARAWASRSTTTTQCATLCRS